MSVTLNLIGVFWPWINKYGLKFVTEVLNDPSNWFSVKFKTVDRNEIWTLNLSGGRLFDPTGSSEKYLNCWSLSKPIEPFGNLAKNLKFNLCWRQYYHIKVAKI